MRDARLILPATMFVFLMGISTSCLAQTSAEQDLTNADVVRMIRAGVPETIIVREIQTSNTDLGTSPAALIELKKQGASENILGAVLDSRSRTSSLGAVAPARSRISAQITSTRPPHLPSFEAAVRVNSTKRETISVGQNHIKVEQSGVPLFTLKWKESSQVK